MKKYKFRAWDTDEYRDHKIVHMDCKEIFKYYPEHLITQWTGVNDKNGIDIYEGDIVKLENILFKVVYVNGRDSDYYDLFPRCAFFGLVPLNQNKDKPLIQIMDFQFDDEYRYEVVGNIFKEKYLEEIKNGDWDDDNY